MATRPLILREGAAPQVVELPRATADALAEARIVEIKPTMHQGWWEVAAGTRIGVATVGELQNIVQPKIDINRLLFLMGYARRPQRWRDDVVRLDPHSKLPEALTDAFLASPRRALGQGLLKGYVTVDESLPVLRGRIHEADQLRRRFGRPSRWRFATTSIRSTSRRTSSCCRPPSGSYAFPGSPRDIGRAITPPPAVARRQPSRAGPRTATWVPSRLNARYAPALGLAELIWTAARSSIGSVMSL